MTGYGVDRGSGASSGGTSGALGQDIIDAKGDLIAGTAADTAARLAVGTNGQRLVADSTTLTGLKWVSDTTDFAVTTKGDLKVATANQTVARLGAGTDGQRLAALASQSTGLKWVDDTQNTVIDVKGDLLVGTAADTLARLPVGTDNQALVADSTQSTGTRWADVPTNTSPHRQTQLAGPVDSSGYNATLAAGAGLNFNVDGTPTNIVLSFAGGFSAAGASDLVTVLTADASNQGSLNASNTHFISATRTSASAVTWGQYLAPPDYAYAFDRTRGALMNFEGTNGSTTIVDDFGNTWTVAGNAQITTAQSKFGTASLLLDGTGDYVTSTNYTTLGDGSWEISCWFRLNSTAGTQTVFNAGNASRFGVSVNAAVGGTAKINLALSSNGSSDDILALTAGTTVLVINTWYKVRIVFDALASTYRAYLSNNGAAETQEITTSSATRVCAITGIRIGETMSTAGQTLNGWVDAFRVLRLATVTATETPSVAAPGITDYPYHWFSIPEMKMYEVTSASVSAGVNPGMTARTRMFVGEADTSGAAVTAIRNYALRGQYRSALVTPLAALSSATTVNHNIGVRPDVASIFFQNVTTELGYRPGDRILGQSGNATFPTPVRPIVDRNTAVMSLQSASESAAPKTGGDEANVTLSKWAYQFVIERGW